MCALNVWLWACICNVIKVISQLCWVSMFRKWVSQSGWNCSTTITWFMYLLSQKIAQSQTVCYLMHGIMWYALYRIWIPRVIEYHVPYVVKCHSHYSCSGQLVYGLSKSKFGFYGSTLFVHCHGKTDIAVLTKTFVTYWQGNVNCTLIYYKPYHFGLCCGPHDKTMLWLCKCMGGKYGQIWNACNKGLC